MSNGVIDIAQERESRANEDRVQFGDLSIFPSLARSVSSGERVTGLQRNQSPDFRIVDWIHPCRVKNDIPLFQMHLRAQNGSLIIACNSTLAVPGCDFTEFFDSQRVYASILPELAVHGHPIAICDFAPPHSLFSERGVQLPLLTIERGKINQRESLLSSPPKRVPHSVT
jgi:hypothetical protein